MSFDKLIQYKALDRIYGVNDPDFLLSMAVDQQPAMIEKQMRNVCALIAVELFDELESMCSLLDITKRRFIEAAISEALDRATRIVTDEGVFDHFQSLSES